MKKARAKKKRSDDPITISGLVTEVGDCFIVDTNPGERLPVVVLSPDAVLNRAAVNKAASKGKWIDIMVKRGGLAYHGYPIDPEAVAPKEGVQSRMISDWSYGTIFSNFKTTGCSYPGCPYHNSNDAQPGIYYCALNLSDAILQSGYTMPDASNVNYCSHLTPRVRNADGMARIVKNQNGGAIDVSGWDNRPAWKGIVYFEGFANATGHIDLWNGISAVHMTYPAAKTIWFWQLAD